MQPMFSKGLSCLADIVCCFCVLMDHSQVSMNICYQVCLRCVDSVTDNGEFFKE